MLKNTHKCARCGYVWTTYHPNPSTCSGCKRKNWHRLPEREKHIINTRVSIGEQVYFFNHILIDPLGDVVRSNIDYKKTYNLIGYIKRKAKSAGIEVDYKYTLTGFSIYRIA